MPQYIDVKPKTGGSGKVPYLTVDSASNLALPSSWNSYDTGYRPEFNQEWNRSDNQAWYGQVWNGLVSRSASIGTKLGAGFGSVAYTIPALVSGDLSQIWDNPITNASNQMDEELRELFPVYHSAKNAQGGLLQKMMTTSFWTDDVFDGLAYVASAAVPGRMIGGAASLFGKGAQAAGAAGEVANAATSTSRLVKGLRAIGFEGLTAKQGTLVGATIYNTIAESGAEAYQTQKELQQFYMSEGKNPEEAKKLAGEHAAEVFGVNMLALLIPNYLQNTFFHGSWADKQLGVRNWMFKNKGTGAGLDIKTSAWKNIGTGIASEGFWEENIQTSVQQYERALAAGLEDKGLAGGIANHMLDNAKGFGKSFLNMDTTKNQDEGALSIFLGGLIGGVFSGIGGARENMMIDKMITQEEGYYSQLFGKGQLGDVATKLLVEDLTSVLKTNGTRKVQIEEGKEVEIPNFETYTDENNVERIKLDESTLHRKTVNEVANSLFWDAGAVAAYTNDPAMMAYNDRMALAQYAYKLATNKNNYSEEELGIYLDQLTAIGTEEAKAIGKETFIKDNIQTVKDDIKRLKELSIQHGAVKTETKAEEIEFNNFLRKVDYFLQVKQAALVSVQQNVTKPEAAETTAKMIQDAEGLRQALTNDREGIRKQFNERVKTPQLLKQEIDKLEENTNKTAEESKRLEAAYFELAEKQHVNGTFAYTDNASAGFGVIVPARRLTQIQPGTRMFHANTTGMQMLATKDALENADNVSARTLASKLLQSIAYDTPETRQAIVVAKEKLNKEKKAYKAGAEVHQALSYVAESLIDEDELEQIVAEQMSITDVIASITGATDPDMLNGITKQFVDSINGKAGSQVITPQTVMTRDLSTSLEDILIDFTENAREVEQSISEQVTALEILEQGLDDVMNSPQAKREEAFKNATDKEEFLLQEFFEDKIGRSADAMIAMFRANPEKFDNPNTIIQLLRILTQAEESYKTRKDITEAFRTIMLQRIADLKQILTDEVYAAVTELASKRLKKQLETNDRAVILTLLNLGILNTDGTLNTEGAIPKLIIGLVGEDKYEQILETITQASPTTYDGVMLLLEKISKSTTESDQIVDILKARVEALANQIQNLSPAAKGLPGYFTSGEKVYVKSPHSTISEYIARIFQPMLQTSAALRKYVMDKDLSDLAARSKVDDSFSQADRDLLDQLLELHYSLVYTQNAINTLNEANVDYTKIQELKKNMTSDVRPSLQQNIVLMDIIRWAFRKGSNTTSFKNWFVLQGIGGSGKTFVVGNMFSSFYKVLTGKSDTILAFSHTDISSKNINEAIFGAAHPNTTFQSFMAMDEAALAKFDMIVLDEAYALTTEQINAMQAKLNMLQQNTQKVIKVLAMGDPSQIVASLDHPLLFATSKDATHTLSLTSTYRTNVGAISSFINNYRLSPESVTNAPIQANMTFEEIATDFSAGLGVTSAGMEDILSAIEKNPSGRSKVVIVPTEEEARALSQRLGAKAQVRTAAKTQGYQWDEVYVLGAPSQYGNNPIEVNRALYTALSRAKSLLVVDSSLGVNALQPSNNIDNSTKESGDEVQESAKLFNDMVDDAEHIKNLLNSLPTVSLGNIEVTEPEFNEDTDIAMGEPSAAAEYDELEQPFTPVQGEPVAKEVRHIAAHPINYNLTAAANAVTSGSTGHIIRAKEGKDVVYFFMVPHASIPGNYVPVAVFGELDFGTQDTGEILLKVAANKPGVAIDINYITRRDSQGIPMPDIEKLSLGKAKLNNFTPIQAMYNMASSYQGPNVIDEVVKTFYNTFFGLDAAKRVLHTAEYGISPEEDWVVNGEVNWKVLRNKVEIRIFNRKNPSGNAAAKHFGVPYIIFRNPKQKGGSSDSTAKDMYIRLQPASFSKRSKQFIALREFHDAAMLFESILGEEFKLGGKSLYNVVEGDNAVGYAKENFEVVDNPNLSIDEEDKKIITKKSNAKSLAEYDPRLANLPPESLAMATEALDKMIKLSYGVKTQMKTVAGKDAAEAFIGQTLNGYKITSVQELRTNTNGVTTYALLYKGDPTSNEEFRYKESLVSEAKGQAQFSLNNIAKANNYVGGNKLRVTVKQRVNGNDVKVTKAKNMFNPVQGIDWDQFWHDMTQSLEFTQADIQAGKGDGSPTAYLVERILNDHLGKVIMTATGEPIEINDEEDVQELINDYRTNPITTSMLDSIVGDNSFDAQGNHISDNGQRLFEPLAMDMVNHLGSLSGGHVRNPNHMDEAARTKLSGLLSSSFTYMQKTEVVIDLSPIKDVPDEPKPEGPKTIGEALGMIPKQNNFLDKLISLLSSSDIIKAVPIEYVETVDGKKGLTRTYVTGTSAKIVTSVDFSKLANSPKLIAHFLHEALHAATLGAITRAKKKIGSEADVKLYKALSSLHRKFNAHVVFTLKLSLNDVYESTPDKKSVAEFVANLSNEKFYKIASSVTLKDKLFNFFKEILNWLGLSTESTVYDTTFSALENFIKTDQQIAPAVNEDAVKDKARKAFEIYKKEFILKLKILDKQLEKYEDEGDDEGIDLVEDQIDTFLKAHPFLNIDFSDNYTKGKRVIKRIEPKFPKEMGSAQVLQYIEDMIASFTSAGAYFTTDPDITNSSPGLLVTTTAVKDYSARFLKGAEWSKKQVDFLFRTVLQKMLIDPETSLITALDAYGKRKPQTTESRLNFLGLLMQDVLSYTDRVALRKEMGVVSDAEVLENLLINFDTADIVQDFLEVAEAVAFNPQGIEDIKRQTIDTNIDRYRAAKEFVLEELYQNTNIVGGSERIKTKVEIIASIMQKVSEPKKGEKPNEFLIGLAKNVQSLVDEAEVLKNKKHKTGADKLRYSKLVNFIIPQAENKLYAITSLGKKNLRTGNPFLFDVLSDINPSNKYTTFSEVEKILVEEDTHAVRTRADDEAKATEGINEYIKPSSKSYELTLSESLKDFLSLVRWSDYGHFVNAGLMYKKTMQEVLAIDWNTTQTGLKHVLTQVETRLQNKVLSDIDKIVLYNLQNLILTALSTTNVYDRSMSLPVDVAIISRISPSGRVEYAAIFDRSPEGSQIENLASMSYDEARDNSNVRISLLTESSKVLIDAVDAMYASKYQANVPIELYNTMFRKAEAINALRELHNGMASMSETDLYIAARKNNKGMQNTYMRSKGTDITFGVKEDMLQTLRELHEEDKIFDFKANYQKDPSTADAWNKLHQGKKVNTEEGIEVDERIDAILVFFSRLGLGSVSTRNNKDSKWNTTLTEPVIAETTEAIKGFLDDMSKAVRPKDEYESDQEVNEDTSSDVTVDGAKTPKEQVKREDFSDWLETQDGRLTKFAELISASSEYVRSSSVTDANGGKFYKIHEASFADDILRTLITAKAGNNFQGTKGSSTAHLIPEYLKTDFFKDNIFVSGLNFIDKMGLHEAAKNTDNDSVTPLTRENMFFFYHREFAQGFLDGIRQSNGKSYYHFLYPPSDKPKYPLVRMGILSDRKVNGKSEIDVAIKKALEQILRKKNIRFNIKNYNNANEKDLFRNFELGQQALDSLGVELTSETIDAVTVEVAKLMELEAVDVLKEIMASDVELTFDARTYKIAGILTGTLKVRETPYSKELATKTGQKFFSRTGVGDERVYSASVADITPMFELFFKNQYINGYFANQLIAGDYSFYKNAADLVKRYAGVLGPGIRPLVDPVIGMKTKFKMMVLDDTEINKGNTRDTLYKLLFEGRESIPSEELEEFERLMNFFSDSFESTDAQGFMIPQRFHDLNRGLGRAWGTGVVMKPMYFNVTREDYASEDGTETYSTAKPTYVKYSSVVITDELAQQFPMLGRIRTNMERVGADELVFASAVKEGMPIPESKVNFVDFANLKDTEKFKKSSNRIMELDNIAYRLQHNPAHDPAKSVSMFTQLMYFLNLYENTQESAREAYQLVADLIKSGREDFMKQITNADGTPSKTKIKKFLVSKFDGPGAERALDLLQAGLSLDQPLLEKKAIIALMSGLESSAIKVKFPGGKLVLQTSEGASYTEDLDLETYKQGDELKYTYETLPDGKRVMMAEVILPEELLTEEQLIQLRSKKGSSIYLYGDAMGFRIPSTELHSAVPLKVVGTYPSKGSNIVIAPKELVALHGSDFDVDALFVITRGTFTNRNNKFTSASTIQGIVADYQNSHRMILEAKEMASPDERYMFDKLMTDINKQAKLFKERFDQSFDGKKAEKDFQDWISMPNYSELHRTAIIRTQEEGYSDSAARRNFAKINNLEWTKKNGFTKLSPDVMDALTGIENEINNFIANNTEFLARNPGIIELIKEFAKKKANVKKLTSRSTLGSDNTAVGYYIDETTGKHVFDKGYLLSTQERKGLNDELADLKDLLNTMSSENMDLFGRDVKSSIKILEEVIGIYRKNAIAEVMLKTITAQTNNARMITPISFETLINSIDNVANDLGFVTGEGTIEANKLSPKSSDLSNIRHKYRAFNDLKDGQILTGAFANAVKVFAYLARAGGDAAVTQYLDDYAESKKKISQLEKLYAAATEGSKEELEKQLAEAKAIAKEDFKDARQKFGQVIKESTNQQIFAPIAKKYQFDITIKGTKHLFNQLTTMMVDGTLTTEVFDTLINAAIDNLKLGHLGRARINSATGSAVVGMLSLGVPLDTIVQLLYQPIFDPLASGKINRVDRDFTAKINKQYEKELEDIEPSISTEMLVRGLKYRNKSIEPTNITEFISRKGNANELNDQLAFFKVFELVSKIGEDIRNLSSYLSIVQGLDVFVEDLDGKAVDFENKIGKIDPESKHLIPNGDFSLVIPYLLINNPHIAESQTTYETAVDLINQTFKVHSPEVRSFVDKVTQNIKFQNDLNEENKTANVAKARRELTSYLLAGLTYEEIKNTATPRTQIKGSNTMTTPSVPRAFSEQTAKRLWALKQHVLKLNNSGIDEVAKAKLKNDFLNVVSIGKNMFGVNKISFKGGVNLNSSDVESMVKGFQNLNRYEFAADGTLKDREPINSADYSDFQKDLIAYAILNYGLQFSTSNFSNYIPASMLLDKDEQMSQALDRIRGAITSDDKTQVAYISSLQQHFKLLLAVVSSDKLPTIDTESSISTSEIVNAQGKSSKNYFGSETIKDADEERTVYFDRRTKKDFGDFAKVSFGKRTEVFVKVGTKKVSEKESVYYYQKIGKSSEAFYTPTPNNYSIREFFDLETLTIRYSDTVAKIKDLKVGDKFTVTSFTPFEMGDKPYINKGDSFYVVHENNMDRINRVYVTLDRVTVAQGKYKSFVYHVEVTETPVNPNLLTEEQNILNDKEC